MKATIKKLKFVGEKEGVSEIKYGHFKTVEEFDIDDKYTDGIDKYTIVTVKKGTANGVEKNTLHIADNNDVDVVPMGIVYAGSVDRKQAGFVEFKKRLPRPQELIPLPLVNWMTIVVEAYDEAGRRVSPAFELEDFGRPVFLGDDGKPTVDKPTLTKYNTPIGYINSNDSIMLDLGNIFPKYHKPVTKN